MPSFFKKALLFWNLQALLFSLTKLQSQIKQQQQHLWPANCKKEVQAGRKNETQKLKCTDKQKLFFGLLLSRQVILIDTSGLEPNRLCCFVVEVCKYISSTSIFERKRKKTILVKRFLAYCNLRMLFPSTSLIYWYENIHLLLRFRL